MKKYQALLRDTLDGNKNAYNEIVRRFQDMAYAIAFKRIRDTNLAQDAVQEAFLASYLKLPALQNLSAFPGWFRAVLISCCQKQIRKNQNSPTLVSLDHAASIPSDLPGPLETLTRFQSRAMVIKTLNSLSGSTREACIQRYIHGRPYKEIAEMLNVPLGTVKRRLHDAREKIIREFKDSDQPVIRVGYLPISDHLIAVVSHYRQNQRGYQIQVQKFMSWSSLVQALLNGIVDMAFIMAPLAMALKNQGAPILYVMVGHHDGSAITVRKDATTRDDFAKTKVGFPYKFSTQEVILHSFLANGGINGKNNPLPFRTRYTNPSFAINSLARRDIDAFFCAEPWNTKAVMQGVGKILARSRDVAPGHGCCVLTVRQDFAAKHGDILRDCLKLFQNSGHYITCKPGPSAKIQAQYTGVDRDVAELVLRKQYITFNDLAPDRGKADALMDLALKTGLLDKACDLDDFICTDYL
jgi:NitT/TauT family transport system substrate-binding protein